MSIGDGVLVTVSPRCRGNSWPARYRHQPDEGSDLNDSANCAHLILAMRKALGHGQRPTNMRGALRNELT